MSDHQWAVNTGRRLIRKHGRLMKVTALQTVPSDPNKPWKGSRSVLWEEQLKACFVPISSEEFLGKTVEDVDLTKYFEQTLLIEAPESGRDLSVATLITDGGREYKIHKCERLHPGDQVILYYAQVK